MWIRNKNDSDQNVRIVEVGPRDGLQNEGKFVSTENKLIFISKLVDAGLRAIEATSFVSPIRIPHLSDNQPLMRHIIEKSDPKYSNVDFIVLTPNMKGLLDALDTGAKKIAVFGAASETFSKRNINKTIEESFDIFAEMCNLASRRHVQVRGYLSCVLGCPYEGEIDPKKVAILAYKLHKMGCYEISLGDTIGVGTPGGMSRLLAEVQDKGVDLKNIAVHCHDTYGQALANILVSLQMGVRTIDSSASGLGGCPYAIGSTGNVATEDVVYLCQGLGLQTHVNMERLLDATIFINRCLGKDPSSKVARALISKRERLARID